MAYEAGAELDMEMVQLHPTGMVWPPGVRVSWSPKRCGGPMAEVRGSLKGLLEREEAPFGKSGSGGPLFSIPGWSNERLLFRPRPVAARQGCPFESGPWRAPNRRRDPDQLQTRLRSAGLSKPPPCLRALIRHPGECVSGPLKWCHLRLPLRSDHHKSQRLRARDRQRASSSRWEWSAREAVHEPSSVTPFAAQ
jgi:hypothetical protein